MLVIVLSLVNNLTFKEMCAMVDNISTHFTQYAISERFAILQSIPGCSESLCANISLGTFSAVTLKPQSVVFFVS